MKAPDPKEVQRRQLQYLGDLTRTAAQYERILANEVRMAHRDGCTWAQIGNATRLSKGGEEQQTKRQSLPCAMKNGHITPSFSDETKGDALEKLGLSGRYVNRHICQVKTIRKKCVGQSGEPPGGAFPGDEESPGNETMGRYFGRVSLRFG